MLQYLADIGIVAFGIIMAILFIFFGTDRLYRFYFGLIIGFLLFTVFNLQVKLVELGNPGFTGSGWEKFLVANKENVLSFFVCMIPTFGFLFMFFNGEVKKSRLFSGLFGFLLPAFILGILGYITLNSSIQLDFLQKLMNFFHNSKIYDILKKAPKLIFGLLLIIIFWKYIFAIILSILGYFAKLITSEINDLKGEENKEEVETKEETKKIKLH